MSPFADKLAAMARNNIQQAEPGSLDDAETLIFHLEMGFTERRLMGK